MGATAIIVPDNLQEYWEHIFTKESDHYKKNNVSIHSSMTNMMYYKYIADATRESSELTCDNSYVYFDDLAKIKFENLKYIMENKFAAQNLEIVQNVFCNAQKTYWCISKFAQRFRVRRAKFQNSTDLYMNPIEPNVRQMTVYQNGALYKFKLSDLINIVNAALTNSSYFFSEPLYPKNPYTNMEFSRGMLLELYIRARESNFKFPSLLYGLLESEFNLYVFVYENDAVIRDMYIDNYVKKSTVDTLYEEVKLMIKLLDRPRRLHIHAEFPKNVLVDAMRPYLHLYLIHEYSLSYSSKRNDALKILKRKFKAFVDFNPNFGRKVMVKTECVSNHRYTMSFNANRPDFNSEPVEPVAIVSTEERDSDEDSD